MKIHIIKARGDFKAGTVVDASDADATVLLAEGYGITESQKADRDAVLATNKKRITDAVTRAKQRGAIEMKDTAVEATAHERLDKGVDADVLVELIEAKASQEVEALQKRFTARVDDDGTLEIGNAGAIRIGASMRDVCENGYLKAREPMDKLIRGGNVKEAMKVARDSGQALFAKLKPIYAKGGDFNVREGVKDVVQAADNIDTNVGTLAAGIVLMRNLGFLKNKLSFLDKISTDLRNEPVLFGQNVLTRYITPPAVLTFVPGIGLTSDATAIANWQATITATNPAGTPQTGTQTRSTASATDVNVVLNKYKGVSIKFNNLQIGGTLRNLFAEQQAAQIYSLAEQVNKDFLTTMFGATWTPATGNGAFSLCNGADPVGPPATNPMGLPTLIAIKNQCSLNKLPDMNRFVLLHSVYHDAVLVDSNLLAAKAILSLIKKDAGSFEDGELPVLFGLKVLESQLSAYNKGGAALVNLTSATGVQAAVGGANGVVGMVGNAASGLFVARVPQDYTKILGEIPATAALEILTEPDSGLSILIKKRVDHNLEETLVDTGLMYNFAQGDPRQGFLLNP